MVVANEPTLVDFVVVIEATANMVAHWDAIKKKYICPAVEYFNGRRPSSTDFIGNNGSSQFGYILFHSYDHGSDLFTSCSSVTQSPWDFVRSLDNILFTGGGCERCSTVAEGLGRALQVFDDLSPRRGQGKSTKVCFLVCNSPPYDLPCYENFIYAGQTSEQLAELMGDRGINLSVISPQHIPQIRQLYLAANHNQSPTLNYAQDPRHLVLISGFSLPTEQDPVKVEPKEETTLVKPTAMKNVNSVAATSSIPSPTVQHSSPAASINHSNQNVTANSPASMLQSASSLPQTSGLSGQPSSGSGIPSMSASPNTNGLIVSSGMNLPASGSLVNATSKAQISGNMIQTSQQMPNYSSGNISQSVSNSSFSRSLNQNSGTGNVVTNARIGANTVPSMEDMLQSNMTQPSTEAQRRMTGNFPVQQGGSTHGNMRHNTVTSVSPASTITQSGGNQGLFSPQSGMKTTGIQDQQRMTPQSVASHIAESTAIGTSNNMPAPPYTNPSLNTNMQSSQKNPLVSATGNDSNFSGSPGSSLLQTIGRGAVRPSMAQTGMINNTNNMQISNTQIPMDQPMNQPTLSMSNNMPRMSNPAINMMQNNEQAPNVVVMSNQTNPVETRPLWRGVLEWKEKRKVPSGTSERTTHHLQCEVFARPNPNDDVLNTVSWPNTLMMQLVPHVVFTYRDMKAQIRNHISVSLRMTPNDQMMHLANTMQNKWMGVIQTQTTPNPQTENKVILVLYSQKNNHFVGLLPRDPATFISTIRQVIQMHQNRSNAGGGAQPMIQPSQNVDMSQFPPENRMTPQNVPNPSHFAMSGQNTRPNLNPAMRPMNPIVQQPNRGLSNQGIAARPSMQMQPAASTQSQINFNQPVQRMQGNPQGVMGQMQQQNNMGPQMQQGAGGSQQFMYQGNVNPRQMGATRPVMNPSNVDIMRQQQMQRMRMQQQQQQSQQLQLNRMTQMPVSHTAGDEQLRSLLQPGSNNIPQAMNQQRPTMHPSNPGMRQMPQGTVRPGYMQNQQQMRLPMQPNRMMGMQQQRFNSGMQ